MLECTHLVGSFNEGVPKPCVVPYEPEGDVTRLAVKVRPQNKCVVGRHQPVEHLARLVGLYHPVM